MKKPPKHRNTGIEMEAGESRLISSAVLSAHDKDTPSSDIIYVFESVPSHGVIQMKVSLLNLQSEKYHVHYLYLKTNNLHHIGICGSMTNL